MIWSIVLNLFLNKIRSIVITTIEANKELNVQVKQLFDCIQQFNAISENSFTVVDSMGIKCHTLHDTIENLNTTIETNTCNLNDISTSTEGLSNIITELS